MAGMIKASNGNYLICGATESSDGDISSTHGGSEAWVIEIDANLNLVWEHAYGGSGADGAAVIIETTPGTYLITGPADSNDGDVSGGHGDTDFWVAEIGGQPTCGQPMNMTTTNAQPDRVTLNWDAVSGATGYQIQYRQSGTFGAPSIRVAFSNTKTIVGLTTGTTYQYRIRAFCPGIGFSAHSPSSFSTPGIRLSAPGNDALSIFPNPVKDLLNVALPDGSGQLKVIGLDGKVHISQTFKSKHSWGVEVLDVSDLPAGKYLLEVIGGSEVWVEGFMKQ